MTTSLSSSWCTSSCQRADSSKTLRVSLSRVWRIDKYSGVDIRGNSRSRSGVVIRSETSTWFVALRSCRACESMCQIVKIFGQNIVTLRTRLGIGPQDIRFVVRRPLGEARATAGADAGAGTKGSGIVDASTCQYQSIPIPATKSTTCKHTVLDFSFPTARVVWRGRTG